MPNAFFCAGLGHWFARVLACARPRRVEILSVHVVLLLGLFMFILSRNNEPWAAAGKLSGELVERVQAHPDPVMRLRLHRYGYDTIAGAYVLRNGLDVAFQPPFTQDVHVVYGWTEAMSPDDPPIPLRSLNEAKIIWRKARSGDEPQARVDIIVRREPPRDD
jgi:hypothetical protein